ADRALADFLTVDRLDPRSHRTFTLAGVGIAHFMARRLDQAAAALLESMQLLSSYVTPYYYLAACYPPLGPHEDARDIIGRLARFTTPAADPLVLKPQPPEQRVFFLAGYRLAMQAASRPETAATTI